MLYELKDVKKIYDRRAVLDINSIQLGKDQVVALTGPNGAGKTTLLEILAFLSRPSAGEIRFQGKKVGFSKGSLMPLRRKVVLIQQQPVLFTTNVYKNVEFPLKVRRNPKVKKERKMMVEEFLDLVGMEMFKNANAHRLSGGETQRVAIAQALACSPAVMLMDEPTASVDVENRIIIERIIKEISRKKGISVIFTTHDMIQASRLADETVFLFEGKLAQSIHENIFSGDIEVDDRGNKYCKLHSDLKLLVSSPKSGLVRISIDPGSVRLGQKGDNHLNGNNLRGMLIQLAHEKNMVRALVDVGIPFSVLMPKAAFYSLSPRLNIGEPVWIHCPKEGIKVF
ncbi:MAG: ATP-binding cassette domain-containing protein [Thermodesulfobacteriota bacterium]|nr:ATP-binding cassette domain-containing protein [Thermodesulfobacteriota bacterium]